MKKIYEKIIIYLFNLLSDMNYYQKYLKYKNKYLELKKNTS